VTSARPLERVLVPRGDSHVAVFRFGPTGGHPVLAIHGITSSHLAWQFLAPRLSMQGRTVWAVDLRGRGDSRAVGGPYGMRVHAEDLTAVLDHLGIASVDVIGHSMGAFVGAALAGLNPQRVDSLTFIDGGIPLELPAGMTVDQVLPLVLGPALDRLSMHFESQQAYRDFWRVHPALHRAWGPELEAYVDHDLRGESPLMHAATDKDSVIRDSEDLWSGDLVDRCLKGLDRDVLMLRAERGLQNEPIPLYPLESLVKAAQSYPRVHVHTIPDTNHYDILMSDVGAEQVAARILQQE
jgi:lipase